MFNCSLSFVLFFFNLTITTTIRVNPISISYRVFNLSFLQIRTMHGRWEAFTGESNEKSDLLFTAKKSKLFQFKTGLDVFLGNNEGEVPDFKIKEGYSKSSCSILLGDSNTMLAQVTLTKLYF